MSSRPSHLTEAAEADLVRRAQTQDREAFEELTRRTTSTSLRLALSIVKDREEAEDQVQNSFLNAWRSLGNFQLEAKFSTWMRTIVVNQSLMHLRTKRRAPVRSLDDDREDGLAIDPPDSRPDQESALSRREMTERLRLEVCRLPPLFRDVLQLCDLQELPILEAAARLGITESAAKSRLGRARAMLRERMKRHTARVLTVALSVWAI